MASINFFTEELDFVLPQKMALRKWVKDTALAEGYKVRELNFIFCSDAYLLNINQQYLNHDTLTDIVTFDQSEEEGVLMGDIFISVERTRENAKIFGVSEADELHRVMIHGVLHLCGYGDKKGEEKKGMTQKENDYLALRFFTSK